MSRETGARTVGVDGSRAGPLRWATMFRTAPRHERAAAIERVSALVGVRTEGQDWDVEQADAGRLDAFCDAYEREALTADERMALMRLIVASCDDSLRAGQFPPALARVEAALRRDFALHFHTVCHWACLDCELEDAYAMAPTMRAIYGAATPPVLAAALADDEAAVAAALAANPGQGELDDALLGAAAHARPEIVRALLAAGASLDAREENGATPLMAAVSGQWPETLRVLLAAGCELEAIDGHGWTALHRATMNGDIAAMGALLAAGAQVGPREGNDYDALMMAVESQRLEAIELLLAHGARVGATSLRGEDALAIARRQAGYAGAGADSLRVLKRLREAVRAPADE